MTKPKRIIVDQIDPERLVPGGTDTCIYDLFKYDQSGSLGLVGITSDKNRRLGSWITIDFAGQAVPFLPVARLTRERGSGLRIPHSAKVALGLLRFRRKLPAGLYQAHRIETGAVLVSLGLKRMVQFIHNDSNGLTGRHSDSVWKYLSPLYRLCERKVFRTAEQVVLFNTTDGPRISELTENLRVTQTWYDPDVFFQNHDHMANTDSPIVVWIGRLEEQKDPVLALEVIAEVLKLRPFAQLVMIGDGSLQTIVEAAIKSLGITDSVRLTGALTREQVAYEMQTANVMLMTSHYEGSPRVLAEGAATGLPVVATEEADTDKVVVDGSNGFRVPERNPEALARAVVRSVTLDRAVCSAIVSPRAAPDAVRSLLGQ